MKTQKIALLLGIASMLLSGSIMANQFKPTLAFSKELYYYSQNNHGGNTSARSSSPTGGKAFIFDPKRLRWYAYDSSGYLVSSGRASGGKNYCPDLGRRCKTPVGKFRVYRKGSRYCKSSKFPIGRGGAPMPYCMFFYHGYAIHGSPDVPNWNASHGCIRVEPHAAQWLHGNFITNGTRVIVKPY